MKNPIVLNNNVIDATQVSFIGEIDTEVKASINVVWQFFTIVIQGRDIKIRSLDLNEIKKLRNELIFECGATTSQNLQGTLPG